MVLIRNMWVLSYLPDYSYGLFGPTDWALNPHWANNRALILFDGLQLTECRVRGWCWYSLG